MGGERKRALRPEAGSASASLSLPKRQRKADPFGVSQLAKLRVVEYSKLPEWGASANERYARRRDPPPP